MACAFYSNDLIFKCTIKCFNDIFNNNLYMYVVANIVEI